jgi:ribosome maturation factor RimP
MQYIQKRMESRDIDGPLCRSLEKLIREMDMSLIEINVFHRKRGSGAGSVQVNAVVLAKGTTGLAECSRAHHAIFPRLELAFPEKDVYLEVSSPGIDRVIKNGSEFVHFVGRGVKCYRTDISDWTEGILRAADEEKIVLDTSMNTSMEGTREGTCRDREITLFYETIAKARLTE